jgi:hypothetical protein
MIIMTFKQHLHIYIILYGCNAHVHGHVLQCHCNGAHV